MQKPMDTDIAFAVTWIGMVGMGVTFAVALWHMRKCIPPKMAPVAAQIEHNHSLATLIARHDTALSHYELWLENNRDWADERTQHAQYLLLIALGPLEAYCYEKRRVGDMDSYYEGRLFDLMRRLDAETDFSRLAELDEDEW